MEKVECHPAKAILAEEMNHADDSESVVVVRVRKSGTLITATNVDPKEALKILTDAVWGLQVGGA